MKSWIAAGVLALAVTGAARAEVTDKSRLGFQITETADIAAPKAKVWEALHAPAKWWNPSHSWTGDAKNLTLSPLMGCLCEELPRGGYARHLDVIYTDEASTLRLTGALGPLVLTGARGNLSVVLRDVGDKTQLTLTYDVGGYAKGGLAKTWAGPVDEVLAEQVMRLKRYAETGKPD